MYIYKATIALILIIISLSVFLFIEISQDVCFIEKDNVWQFVVWVTSKYCYARGQEPKHLKIYSDFHTLEECEEFLHANVR